MNNKSPTLLATLKIAIQKEVEKRELTKFSITNGHELLLVIQTFVRHYPNRYYAVAIIYEILSGKDRKYFRTNNFRTVTFQNIHVSDAEGILADINNFILEKGEIYFPEDPYNIAFEKVSISAQNKTFRRSTRSNRLADRFFNRFGVLRMERVNGLIDALKYAKDGKHPGTRVDIRIPQVLLNMGIKTMTQFDDMDIDEQIKIFNQVRIKAPNSFFKHKTLKVFTRKDQIAQEWTDDPNIVYLYMSTDLYIIVLDSFENINLIGEPIRPRNVKPIPEAIYVTYDTEWVWKNEEAGSTVSQPNLLTYCVISMSDYIATKKQSFVFKTNYFLGTDCVLQFLEVLVNLVNKYKNKTVYAIAHNASDIEHTFIINAITKWFEKTPNYFLKFTHVNGSHVKSLVWRNIEFRDSLLFIPLPLAQIGEALDLDTHKLEISTQELQEAKYDDPDFETSVQGKRIIEYACNDSLVLAKAVIKFVWLLADVLQYPQVIDFINFLSSSSIIKWWLLAPDGELSWDSPDICKFRNSVFFGGRNECYFIGTNHDFCQTYKNNAVSLGSSAYAMSIDVTSSYPYSMAYEFLPGDPISICHLPDFKSLKQLLENKSHIYGIYGKLKYNQPMPLPLIGIKQNDKLIFPNFMAGDYSAFMWDFEVLASMDYIEDITDITVITFKTYIQLQAKIIHLFEGRKLAKKQNNKGLAFVYKILMNSGYGSLGLKYLREEAVLAKGTALKRYQNVAPKNIIYEGPNGFTWIVHIRECKVNTKVFMASYITAKSRYILWLEMVRLSQEENAIVLYCDTDSIIFVDKKEKELYYKQKYVGNELGSWKFEGAADSWEIVVPKVYRFGSVIKYKGVNVKNKNMLTDQDRLIDTTTEEVWGVGRDASITIKTMTKKMSFRYTKGFVWPNGLVTPPTF